MTKKNGQALVEIKVKTVDQLFDRRDPSPFRERDLDDDLVKYIVSSAEEYSLKIPIQFRFIITDERLSPTDCESVAVAFRAHFSYESDLIAQQLKNNHRTGRVFLLIGLVSMSFCLTVANYVGASLEKSAFQQILQEGLTITGWVAMWRPIEVFLYSWWPILNKKRCFNKLASAKVDVRTASD